MFHYDNSGGYAWVDLVPHDGRRRLISVQGCSARNTHSDPTDIFHNRGAKQSFQMSPASSTSLFFGRDSKGIWLRCYSWCLNFYHVLELCKENERRLYCSPYVFTHLSFILFSGFILCLCVCFDKLIHLMKWKMSLNERLLWAVHGPFTVQRASVTHSCTALKNASVFTGMDLHHAHANDGGGDIIHTFSSYGLVFDP